jgi:hypothetical protein
MASPFFQAFAIGAATTITENIKREEKNARELAAAQAEMLISNHNKVRDAREKQANKMIDDVDFLSSQFPTISKDDLVLASTNPSAVAALRARAAQPDWNPQSIKFSDFAELTSANTGDSVSTLVNNLFDKSVAKKTAIEKDLNMSLLQRITAAAQEQELKRIVAPLGYDVDKLRADVGRRPEIPEGKVKFNLGVLATPSYDAEFKKAKLDVVKAQEANDPVALAKASVRVSAFVVAESLTRTESLSNEQIQSNLVTKIQSEKDPKVRAKLELELKERQKLLTILPPPPDRKITESDIRTDLADRIIAADQMGDKRTANLLRGELKQRQALIDKQENNSEKISAANYISASTKGVASAVQDVMPPGSFVVVTGADGTTTIQPKDLAAAGLYKQGVKNGRTAVISQMTGPDGKPKSELHKTALIAVGVVFDKNNVARLPAEEGAPPAPVVTPAPPAPAKPAAAPPQKLPTPAQFNAKWATLKSGQSMIGPDGQTHTKK